MITSIESHGDAFNQAIQSTFNRNNDFGKGILDNEGVLGIQ